MSMQMISTQHAGFMDFSRIDAAFKCCEMIAKASFCPKDFRGKPEEVLCAIQYGMEIGLSPMQAIQSIAVINGKPSIYGDGLIGLCLAFPECEDIQETFDEATMTATCRVKRRGKTEVVSVYSRQDAEKAKLWGKVGHNGQPTPWVTYPRRMLQMRARGFALRDAFADRLKGIITAEEARDYPVKEERPLNVVTPINKNVPRETIEQKVSEHTKNHLLFLVQETQTNEAIKQKWFSRANALDWNDFSEYQAEQLIKMLEKRHPDAAQSWIEVVKIRDSYNKQLAN